MALPSIELDTLFGCSALAVLVSGVLLLLRWREAVGADEGYLWYGTLRVLEGRVPVRDFRSYEPGRYLWCAPFVLGVGRGILGVRVASHAFFALSLGVALTTLAAIGLSPLAVLGMASVLAAWAFPQHKLFEPGMALLHFTVIVWLFVTPGATSALAVGGLLGLAALFGLNLALYVSAGVGVAFVLVLWVFGQPAGLLGAGAMGLTLGLLPLLGYALGARGFARALFERRLRAVFERGTTNLPLRIPFPWREDTVATQALPKRQRVLVAWMFLILPVVPAASILAVVVAGTAPESLVHVAMMGGGAAGLLGWHHAYSRADPRHLAQSIFPLLLILGLGCYEWLGSAAILPLGIGMLAITWPWLKPHAPLPSDRCEIRDWKLEMLPLQVQLLEALRELREGPTNAGGSLLALPTLAWVYPALDLRSPVYDLFCVYPASGKEQSRMIAELEEAHVALAVISTERLDGNPGLTFERTHPMVVSWLQRHFDAVLAPRPTLAERFIFLRRRGG